MNSKDCNHDNVINGDNNKFCNVVSLGCFCGTAASMEKNGFRSFSGPFDWCCTDIEGIVHILKNHFSDFMLKENLIQLGNFEFRDIKNGFFYNHDLYNKTLDEAYPIIKEKYNKRVTKFLDSVKKPTCFIRAIGSKEELQYIKKHYNEIQKILLSYNYNNEIIYIIPKDIGDFKNIPIKIFPIDKYDVNVTVNQMFEQNTNICEWLNSKVDPKIIANNLLFENKKLLLEKEQFQIRYNMACNLCNFNNEKFYTENNYNIIIYGAGKIGKIFYDKILNKKNTIGFLDQYSKEDEYKNIPIFKSQDLKSYLIEKNKKEIMFIITTTYDYGNIINEIKANYSNFLITIVSLSELLNKYKY